MKRQMVAVVMLVVSAGLLSAEPVSVFDITGRLVRKLADYEHPGAGQYAVSWDSKDAYGRALPAGVYFMRLRAAGLEASNRAVLLR